MDVRMPKAPGDKAPSGPNVHDRHTFSNGRSPHPTDWCNYQWPAHQNRDPGRSVAPYYDTDLGLVPTVGHHLCHDTSAPAPSQISESITWPKTTAGAERRILKRRRRSSTKRDDFYWLARQPNWPSLGARRNTERRINPAIVEDQYPISTYLVLS